LGPEANLCSSRRRGKKSSSLFLEFINLFFLDHEKGEETIIEKYLDKK